MSETDHIPYMRNGKEVTREEFDATAKDWPPKKQKLAARNIPMLSDGYRDHRPLNSLALSCHREQVEEYNQAAKDKGLTGLKWDRDGNCQITSRRDRAAWLRENKMLDHDGGYGDG